jgi:hypothetical protein
MHFYYLGSKNPNAWCKVGKMYQAVEDIYVYLRDDTGFRYTWHLLPGFRTDMGSVPAVFQWFVPGYSKDNYLINLAYYTHDAAYASGLVPKGIADDMLRGILRDAGVSRLRASTVCWCVNTFAASHYGPENDTDNNRVFVKLTVSSDS